MSIVFRCPCGKEAEVFDSLAGQTWRCKACGEWVVVPPKEGGALGPAPKASAASPSGAAPTGSPPGAAPWAGKPCPMCRETLPAGSSVCRRCGWDAQWNVRVCPKCGGVPRPRLPLMPWVLGGAPALILGLLVAWEYEFLSPARAATVGAAIAAACAAASFAASRVLRYRCDRCGARTRPGKLSDQEQGEVLGMRTLPYAAFGVLALSAIAFGVAAARKSAPKEAWTPPADVEALRWKGAAAAPELARALRDKRVCLSAAQALVEMGGGAVPALAVALRDPEREVRYLAASALLKIGARAAEAVDALAAALKDKYPEIRVRAVMTLGKIGPPAASAAPALKAAMKDSDGDVRREAEEALKKVAP